MCFSECDETVSDNILWWWGWNLRFSNNKIGTDWIKIFKLWPQSNSHFLLIGIIRGRPELSSPSSHTHSAGCSIPNQLNIRSSNAAANTNQKNPIAHISISSKYKIPFQNTNIEEKKKNKLELVPCSTSSMCACCMLCIRANTADQYIQCIHTPWAYTRKLNIQLDTNVGQTMPGHTGKYVAHTSQSKYHKRHTHTHTHTSCY